MFHFRSERRALALALLLLASLSFAACSGGATAGSAPPASTSSGSTGTGGSGTGGSGSAGGSATSSPSAGGSSSGGATATPTPASSSGGSGGASAAPVASPSAAATSASTPSSIDSISVVPAVLDGDLGGVAQIGVLDPNYTGAYTVNVTGGGLLLNSIQTLSNVINGTLTGSGGETTLSLNLANAVQLGLLGPNGDVVQICEQQNPTTCKSVSITNNGVVPQVGASLDSIVFGAGGEELLSLIAPMAQTLSGFTVTALPSGISVTNLGNGQFEFSAAANVAVPITGNVTLTNGTQTITIPISVL